MSDTILPPGIVLKELKVIISEKVKLILLFHGDESIEISQLFTVNQIPAMLNVANDLSRCIGSTVLHFWFHQETQVASYSFANGERGSYGDKEGLEKLK